MSKKILCVDDEPKVLSALHRQLHDQFEIETADGGAAALEAIASRGPFAVVVSDMRMPEMDGIQLLAQVKSRSPDSVRIMLTGNADQQTAIDAVNQGNIFRFLTKPCPQEAFAQALTAGIEQYRLITAEKELLGKTLGGAIKVLCEVLTLTNPAAFVHASRVQRLIRKVCKQMLVDNSWEIDVAAMLSQIGCVTVPSETLENVHHGRPLAPDEIRMLEAHPAVGSELVNKIPRLENVARIISYQQKGFDGTGAPRDALAGYDIPFGARILKAAVDYDRCEWGGLAGGDIMTEMRRNWEQYDPEILDALEAVSDYEATTEIREVRLEDLETNSILAEDVIAPNGTLMVGKGQEVTSSLNQRLRNFAKARGYEGKIRFRVIVKKSSRKMPPN